MEIHISFPIVALSINIALMFFKNLTLELRQRGVSNKINKKMLDYMLITRKVKRFLPIYWADVKVGHIIRIKSGQEFPADCLILDI
jgi:magnesium-transporting ATPase (P-type)